MAVAAYGSLLSWTQSLHRVQQLHDNGRIIVHKQQILDLQNKVNIVLQFLEALPHQALTNKMETLTREIKVVVVETELLIDSHVLEQFDGKIEGFLSFTQSLNEVILKFDLLICDLKDELVSYLQGKVRLLLLSLQAQSQTLTPQIEDFIQQVMVIAVEIALLMDQFGENNYDPLYFEKCLIEVIHKLESIERRFTVIDMSPEVSSDESLTDSNHVASSYMNSSENVKFVGLEENVTWIIGKLTSHEKSLQIIPIVGMGGIGKTTLAQHVFDNPQMKLRFEKRIWCKISQNYNEREILQSLLQDRSSQENRDLGLRLYQNLHHRRYLIVLDDMWSIDSWEYLMKFLPNKMNYSRVIVTTRMSNVADSINSRIMQCIMKPLDDHSSWNLLCESIFFGQDCPSGLVKIGKDIAKNCWGLPLSLITIGGLLSNSNMTVEYWENVAENVKRRASYGDCMKILSLSYRYLPIHLKLCFLYFRMLRKNTSTEVKSMLKEWIIEGFVKPVPGKSIEEIAYKYMNDLSDRNLIFLYNRSSTGEVSGCGIHDLLQELCLGEAEKENFLLTPRTSYHSDIACYLCGLGASIVEKTNISQVVPSKEMSHLNICRSCKMEYPLLGRSKFVNFSKSGEDQQFMYSTTSRCAFISDAQVEADVVEFISPLPVLYLWNVQVLELYLGMKATAILPVEIWEMQQLRILIIFNVVLPEPGENTSNILDQIHTIWTDVPTTMNKRVVERIPNLTNLRLSHFFGDDHHYASFYPLNNLASFEKLESLQVFDMSEFELKIMSFPCSLKELIIHGEGISEEQMMKIGSLPNLEILQLEIGKILDEWNTVEGQFIQLKVLELHGNGIKLMEVECDDFPNLEKLVFKNVTDFEIPTSIGDNPCLRSIHLDGCDEIVVRSAVQIVEEQLSYGNASLELYSDYKRFMGSYDDLVNYEELMDDDSDDFDDYDSLDYSENEDTSE